MFRGRNSQSVRLSCTFDRAVEKASAQHRLPDPGGRSHPEDIVRLLGDEALPARPVPYGPLPYLPVLMKKPGPSRNGAPFKDLGLPPARAHNRAS
jgi:hypothetical protein